MEEIKIGDLVKLKGGSVIYFVSNIVADGDIVIDMFNSGYFGHVKKEMLEPMGKSIGEDTALFLAQISRGK